VIRKQLIVLGGSAAALVAVILMYQNAAQLFARVKLPADDTASRLAFVADWLILPGISLLAGIIAASQRRFFSAQAIDGTRTPAHPGLEINLRYNQNTLEQCVLAAIAWTALALAVPHEKLALIPAMACLFGIGRIAFWIGYLLHPLARAFGMVLTGLPTLCAFVWLVWHAQS
jgi:MAPEG family